MARSYRSVSLAASAVLLVAFAAPAAVSAAMLYLDPSSGTFLRGDTFSVKVRLDNGDECVNAADVRIGYPADIIKAIDVSTGASILPLFTEPPAIDAERGMITFSGGVPGGYCGRVAGDPGVTNVLAELIFQAPGLTVGGAGSGGAISFLDGSTVLLADGAGTPARLTTRGMNFSISTAGASVKDPWIDTVQADRTQPQAFAIELSRDKSIFNGAWFVAFSTTDKESGIDHYELMEVDIEREGYVVGTNREARWERATSPYRLNDQTLNSIIRVKAVDKANNERIAAKIPEESLRRMRVSPVAAWGAAALAFGAIALAVYYIVRRIRRSRVTEEQPVPPPSDVPPTMPPPLS